MFIFSDPNNCISAPKTLQMCSYFSLFVSLPKAKELTIFPGDMWREDQILNNGFIQSMAQSLAPDGIGVETHFKSLRTGNSSVGVISAEYQVILFGERLPVTNHLSQTYKQMIEDEVDRKTAATRRSKWPASYSIPSSLVRAHLKKHSKVV